MLFSLLLFSLVTVLFRSASKVERSPCLFVWKILSLIFGMLFSMAISFVLIGNILELLPFSAVMYIVLRSRSMLIHFRRVISPILAPVSLSSCRSVDVLVVPAEIRESISFSVGMYGKPCCLAYFGCVHVLPMYFR